MPTITIILNGQSPLHKCAPRDAHSPAQSATNNPEIDQIYIMHNIITDN